MSGARIACLTAIASGTLSMAFRLGRQRDVAVLEARRDARGLVRLLRHERSLPQNEAAAAALTRVADAASLPVLVKASASSHSGERQAALSAIAAIRDLAAAYPLARLATTDGSEVGRAACQSLAGMGRDSLAAFLAGLTARDPQERERFACELGHLDDEVSPRRALPPDCDSDPTVRSLVVGALVRASWDPELGVRVAALRALTKLAELRAPACLIAHLLDESSMVRAEACRGLGSFSSRPGIDALIVRLNDEDREVRISAANALANIGTPAARAVSRAVRTGTPRVVETISELVQVASLFPPVDSPVVLAARRALTRLARTREAAA